MKADIRPAKSGAVAGTPLLIVLAMAQFMVVLDRTNQV